MVHPVSYIPIAAFFFFIPALLFRHSIKIPQAQLLGIALGAIPALVSLAAGFAQSDLGIVEGSAQFYTDIVTGRMAALRPACSGASSVGCRKRKALSSWSPQPMTYPNCRPKC